MASVAPYTGTTLLFANNAGSTLAGPISNTSTSLALQSGGGALFPAPGMGQSFIITITDAATGLLNEIIQVKSVSGDTFSGMVRGREGTTALNWLANDIVRQLWTAGQAASINNFLQKAPSNTFYVDIATGNDSNPGTLSLPFQTLNGAVSAIISYVSLSQIVVNVASGNYSSNVLSNAILYIPPSYISSWSFIGSGTGSCTIDGSSAGLRGVLVAFSQTVSLSGFTIKGYNECVSSQGSTALSNCTLSLQSSSSYGIAAYAGASIVLTGAIGFTGSGTANVAATSGGAVQAGTRSSVAITYTANTVSLGNVAVSQGGIVQFVPAQVSFSGTPTGPRCQIDSAGGISAGGLVGGTYPSSYTSSGTITTYVPGTSNGVWNMPGWIA